ncbi:family 61 glycoside hydrolase [Tirmania nivea]|nr:family 61 glycoside hydrolase [Tirmania nivea]
MWFSKNLLLGVYLAASSGLVSAHSMVTNMIINGVDQGPGKCMRIPPNTDPVIDMRSNDMSCNVNGEIPVARACPVAAGSEITFVWRTWPDASQPGSLNPGHQGPCAVYMKAVSDVTKSPGYGGGWFKIWHDGYRDGKFCAQRIIENNGRMTVKIPSDLKGGDYLIRVEQLALHQAQKLGGAQWYVGCGQLIVSSTGGSASPSWVSIPGHSRSSDPGVHYQYFSPPNGSHNGYVIPGPPPYQQGKTVSDRPIEDRKERGNWNCLVENANWCARAVPGFKSIAECWSASANGFSQLRTCYNTAPRTGHKGCDMWGKICTSYHDHCRSCEGKGSCSGTFTN